MENARHVDWKATAHTGTLQVREFAREQDWRAVIFLDLDAPLGSDAWFDQAVECCAFLAYRLAERGVEVRFRTQELDLSLPDAERLVTIQRLFFAPGHDPSVWLHGWHPQANESQRLASAATRQAEWWAAGTVPLLDLQAAHDPFKPREKTNELVDELGDRVTIVVIPDASHALIPEQPAAVIAAIVAWVRKL